MEIKDIYSLMMNKKYYTQQELKYNTDPGLFLSPYNYQELLTYFDKSGEVHTLDLSVFNSFKIRFSPCLDLNSSLEDYLRLIDDDTMNNQTFLTFRKIDEITKSRIFSEIEGSLNIESVPTTRTLLNELIIKKRKPISNNEQIIVNMSQAIEFVNTCPDFNEGNLFKLYSILSYQSLEINEQLKKGDFYRYDEVEIDNYHGCPAKRVKEMMDSLFIFINGNLKNSSLRYFLPHIAHYYILYIHPYFNLNGRTARMVSYWISLLLNETQLPPIISEAINQTKNEYYNALRETRNSHNDITYFLLYIYKVSRMYFLTYQNIEHIETELKNKAIVISESDKTYLKRILISKKGKFTYEDFIKLSNTTMSKQAAFKILNKLESYGLLISEINKSNKKLYEINITKIKYKTSF